MTGVIQTNPKVQFLAADGSPLVGGKLYTYLAGTSTLTTTWQDLNQSTANTNPIILDARGEAVIWLDPALDYKFVLQTSASVAVWTVDNISGAGALADRLRDELAASGGSSLVGFIQAGTGAVARTVQAKDRDFVSVKDFGAVGDDTTDDTAFIQAAEDACALSGNSLYFPAGTYRCNSGITKKSVNWVGAGKYKTKLAYRGNSTFINATGTSPSRKLFTISDMELNGTNAGAAAVGITLGWNQRSTPLVRVHIYNFGHYGIHFNDENWIVDFYDVEVDTCGGQTTNSSGIFKNSSIDASTWNAISFHNLTVEACGSASSDAGGVRLPTDNANRGLYFYSPCIEGNFGTAEIYISNMADCQFHNLYMEVVSAQATNAVELYGVTGGFTGGYITGDNIVTNLIGVKIGAGGAYVPNEIEFDKITISNFANSVSSESAKIWTNQIHGNRTFADPSTSTQYFGDYSPRFSAVKSANQTITSGSFQKVTFETDVYDLCGKFASSSWTPQTIGTYQIDASIRFLTCADQARIILCIYVRGSSVKSVAINCSGTGEQSFSISAQVDTQLTTDAIEIYVRQDSGSDRAISSGSAETFFMGSLIGRIA